MRMCGARRLVASGWVVGAVVLAGARGGQVPAQDARSKPAAQQPADNPRADGAATEMVRMLRGGGMQLEKIVNEKRQAYRSLLSSELSFCRVACDLTKEQSQRIARCSAAMIEEAAQTAARLDLKPAQRGGIRYAGEPALPNAVKLVRRSLEQLVKEHGSPEQQNRYRLELARRAARQRQTAIWGLVARLDRILIFSSVSARAAGAGAGFELGRGMGMRDGRCRGGRLGTAAGDSRSAGDSALEREPAGALESNGEAGDRCHLCLSSVCRRHRHGLAVGTARRAGNGKSCRGRHA